MKFLRIKKRIMEHILFIVMLTAISAIYFFAEACMFLSAILCLLVGFAVFIYLTFSA